LAGLPVIYDRNLLVGYDTRDDAAVYELENGALIISTADFFPPMTDDPYVFGKIAAANALSDVYAMGGKPVMALNLACFPQDVPSAALAEILRGGAEKLAEAGAVLAGGHSIYDAEVKYGLAVTGLAVKDKLLRNNTPLVGHALILTKALGTGIVMAAHRDGEASDSVEAALASMERLNKYAAEKLDGFAISACTDITGFGLICHALEMAGDSVTIVFDSKGLPVLPGAERYAEEEYTTGGGNRNRQHAGNSVDFSGMRTALQEVCFDPQTSGGLLIAVDSAQAGDLLAKIRMDDPVAAVIGRIAARESYAIRFD